MGESQQVCPVKGTVSFGSALFGWGFTLTQFARVYAQKFKLSQEVMIEKLWGENYLDKKNKLWRTVPESVDGEPLQRAFNVFIMELIIRLARNCMESNIEAVTKMIEPLGIALKAEEKELKGKNLLKNVFQKWINSADMLLELIITKLPSPRKAQAYRAAHLYTGSIQDECGQAIKNCDPEGPLMVYISKMVPTTEKGRFYAFGRVFSGTVRGGQKVRIMGPKYKAGSSEDLYLKSVQRTCLMMGDKGETVPEIPCGNTCALVGIDKFINKQATISDNDRAEPMRLMKYSVSPVVKVAVRPKNPADLPKLVEGLRRLSNSDQIVETYVEATGEHIVAGCGELHMEICLSDLAKFSQCEIIKSEPIVTYKETVMEESSMTCLAKSANRHNRLFARVQPLDEQLVKAIEEEKVSEKMETKELQRILTQTYGWDPNDAKKLWTFAPDLSTNCLVDQTKGIMYLNEIKDHVVSGFQWAAREGVLAEEEVRGVRMNLLDAALLSDAIHRGAGQLIPAARRVFYASCLTAQPRFQEPVLLCEIQTPEDAIGGIYNTLAQRRGCIIGEEPIPGTPMLIVKSYLPVAESFGFSQLLREQTSGRAFPQMMFDHWELITGDPLEAGSRASKVCESIRARKGLKLQVPGLENFHDRL